MLKIRLQRTGRKGQPFYRVVVVEHSASAKSNFTEKLGFYNPLEKPWKFEVDTEKVLEWISKGAQPSNTVARLLKKEGVEGMEKFIKDMPDRKKKNAPEKEEEREEAPAPAADEVEPAAEEAPAEEVKEEEAKEEEATDEDSKEA